MSADIVKDYSETLAESMKTKQFEKLLSCFANKFEISASLMGKSYHFTESEKFKKFLENIPSGIQVSVNKILNNEDGSYTAKVAMGMGFMKMPGKWQILLDDSSKIKSITIS